MAPPIYDVEFSRRDTSREDSAERNYSAKVREEDVTRAGPQARSYLSYLHRSSGNGTVLWNANIIDGEERRPILKDGEWLVEEKKD